MSYTLCLYFSTSLCIYTLYMVVSWNGGTLKSSIYRRISPGKPSIFGGPPWLLWKSPFFLPYCPDIRSVAAFPAAYWPSGRRIKVYSQNAVDCNYDRLSLLDVRLGWPNSELAKLGSQPLEPSKIRTKKNQFNHDMPKNMVEYWMFTTNIFHQRAWDSLTRVSLISPNRIRSFRTSKGTYINGQKGQEVEVLSLEVGPRLKAVTKWHHDGGSCFLFVLPWGKAASTFDVTGESIFLFWHAWNYFFFGGSLSSSPTREDLLA